MKFTRTYLKHLETIFEDMDFTVIYEKGSFQSGYCLVEGENVIVINKFYDTEARINCLIQLLDVVDIEESRLQKPSLKFYKKLGAYKSSLPLDNG